MDTIDKFEIEIIFKNIYYLIDNKISKLSFNSIFYLDKSISFINDLIKSLDSLNYTAQTTEADIDSYVLFPNLKEVVSSVPNTSGEISKSDLILIKKYFSERIREIEKLKKDPKKFYKTGQWEQLQSLANNISLIHSESFFSHSFEVEETFSNSFFLC